MKMNALIFIVITVGAALLAVFKGMRNSEKAYNLAKVPPAVRQWETAVQAAAKRYGVPFPVALSVLWVESAGDENARGSAGEVGLMQLKPIAVKDLLLNGYDEDLFSNYERNPIHNINAGVAFLSLQKKRTGNWNEAVQAYNQGFAGMNKTDLDEKYLSKVMDKKQFFA